MPVAVHLRNEIESCVYRDAIIQAINSGLGDEAIMCSGFFQENFKGSAYQASAEIGLISGLVKHNVALETFGVHNSPWIPSYKQFCSNMRSSGVSLSAWVQKGYQWHAKVFILKKSGSPIFGIIGSSNVTANAFGVRNKPAKTNDSPNPPNKFNYEADVYLWESANHAIGSVIAPLMPVERNSLSGLRARYYESDNGGLTVTQRLRQLEAQVRGAGTNVALAF